MAMKKNISKALAMAVMMSVLAGGSAYADTKVIINGILDSTSHADPANGPSVKVVKDPYGSASYGYSHAQFNQDGKVMTVGSYGINLFSDNSLGIHNLADGVKPNDAVNKGQMDAELAKKVDAGTATGLDALAVGKTSKAEEVNSMAIGNSALASEDSAIAMGNSAYAGGSHSVAIGNNAYAEEIGAYAIGQHSSALGKNSYAIGNNASAKADNSIALGNYSVAEEINTISVGPVGGGRRIVNVAKGEKDTDAVNFSQIKAVDGNYVKEANTVAENFTALDTQVKANADNIDKKADKTALDAEAKAREQGDADTLKKANEYTDQEIAKISGGASTEALEKLDNKINQTNDRVDRVGATAAALAAINYQPMAKGQSQVAIGMGGYKGKKATALGLAYQISDRISGSVAGAANGSERMFNVGFNYLFGQHSDKDVAQCAAVPGSVSLKEAELQATIDSQGAKINTLEAEIAELKAIVKALAAK